MSAELQVRRTRRLLLVALAARAALTGGAVALAAVAVIALLRAARLEPEILARSEGPAVLALALLAAALVFWRSRAAALIPNVALWIEEQAPTLSYALVTAVDPSLTQPNEALERVVAQHDLRGVVSARVRRSLLPAAGGALLAALVAIGALALARLPMHGSSGRSAVVPPGTDAPLPNRLETLRLTVTPPAYTRLPVQELGDVAGVSALVGSRVEMRGLGPAEGVYALLGDDTLKVEDASSDWRTALVMPRNPAALMLRDREYERILVLAPIMDEPPSVRLTLPARDTIYRTVPQAPIRLLAEAADDFGLADGYFEYMITSGSGEEFTGRTTTSRRISLDGKREGELKLALSLSALGIGPGDIVSVRAVARDRNDVTGPGVGTSDTRTFRIMRMDEGDSVSINPAAPPAIDSTWRSQRMLILMTEALQKAKPQIARESFERQSRSLAIDQGKIRMRVSEIINQERAAVGGGDPEMLRALTKDLQEAHDHMWDAERELQIASTETALPFMYKALAILDRLRNADRYYLRGAPPRIVVDVAAERLTGTDTGTANQRSTRGVADTLTVRLRGQFLTALGQMRSDSVGAGNALALLRVEALRVSPELADALGEAIESLRTGQDPTPALVRARRALDGGPLSITQPKWSISW